MVPNERSAERTAIWVGVVLEICDASTHAAVSPSFPATAVDISAGGMRFELRQLPAGIAEALSRDSTIRASFESKDAQLKGRVHLKVAWFRPAGQTGRASVGAYFTEISDDDRAALMQLAAMQISQKFQDLPKAVPQNLIRTLGFLSLLAVAAFGAFQSISLHSRIDEMSEQIEKMSFAIETQRQALAKRSATETAERAGASAMATAAVKPEPKRVAPEQAPPQPPDRSPASETSGTKPKAVDFVLREKLDGIRLATLEVFQSDFIGALISETQVDKSVTVALEYPCARGEAPGRGNRCTCEARQMRVPKGGRVEFTCTSSSTFSPGADDRVVLVSIR